MAAAEKSWQDMAAPTPNDKNWAATGSELAEAFGEHAPDLRGIKCSRYEGWHVLDYLNAHGGRYDVLCGTDEALLSAL